MSIDDRPEKGTLLGYVLMSGPKQPDDVLMKNLYEAEEVLDGQTFDGIASVWVEKWAADEREEYLAGQIFGVSYEALSGGQRGDLDEIIRRMDQLKEEWSW